MRRGRAIVQRGRITGARARAPLGRPGYEGATAVPERARPGYRPLALVFHRPVAAGTAHHRPLVFKAGDEINVTLAPRFHLALSFFERMRTLVRGAGLPGPTPRVAANVWSPNPRSKPTRFASSGRAQTVHYHWRPGPREARTTSGREAGRDAERFLLPLGLTAWRLSGGHAPGAPGSRRRRMLAGAPGTDGATVPWMRPIPVPGAGRELATVRKQRLRRCALVGVGDGHEPPPTRLREWDGISLLMPGRAGRFDSEETGGRMPHRAVGYLPAQSQGRAHVPTIRTVAPMERVYRDVQPKAAPTMATNPPPPPASLPVTPGIDMDRLDKDLWRRFEKRVRVERERRGRL